MNKGSKKPESFAVGKNRTLHMSV